MDFQINEIPFKMDQIPATLFNKQFLSDVTFIIDGKTIYAHSLELMKRSNVFQKQMEPTLGEKKIILITDYGYDTFYQFIRFMYTDEWDIPETNHRELLKLANAYHVVRLVNDVLNYSDNIENLDFCCTTNRKIGLNDATLKLASNLNLHLKSDKFLSVHPDTVGQILNLDLIPTNVKEIDLINALECWMEYDDRRRDTSSNLIHLVRFPIMAIYELREIKRFYPNLLTKSDFLELAGHKVYGDGDCAWNCIPRIRFEWPYHWMEYTGFTFETKFTVSSDLILGGLVLGSCQGAITQITIIISCVPSAEIININEIDVAGSSTVVSFGTSIRIRRDYRYTIYYKYTNRFTIDGTKKNLWWSRKPETKLIINGPDSPNSVNILETPKTMLEIFFLQPEEEKINE